MAEHTAGEYRIRAATPGDVPAMVRMRLALQDHMAARTRSLWGMSEKRVANLPRRYRERIADQAECVLVVDHLPSGAPVGMGSAAIHHHDDYAPAQSGGIEDVWIDPEHRGKGLCRALFLRLLAFFEEQGVTDLLLRYADGNEEAKTVWTHYGFRPTLITATACLGDVEAAIHGQQRGENAL